MFEQTNGSDYGIIETELHLLCIYQYIKKNILKLKQTQYKHVKEFLGEQVLFQHLLTCLKSESIFLGK